MLLSFLILSLSLLLPLGCYLVHIILSFFGAIQTDFMLFQIYYSSTEYSLWVKRHVPITSDQLIAWFTLDTEHLWKRSQWRFGKALDICRLLLIDFKNRMINFPSPHDGRLNNDPDIPVPCFNHFIFQFPASHYYISRRSLQYLQHSDAAWKMSFTLFLNARAFFKALICRINGSVTRKDDGGRERSVTNLVFLDPLPGGLRSFMTSWTLYFLYSSRYVMKWVANP